MQLSASESRSVPFTRRSFLLVAGLHHTVCCWAASLSSSSAHQAMGNVFGFQVQQPKMVRVEYQNKQTYATLFWEYQIQKVRPEVRHSSTACFTSNLLMDVYAPARQQLVVLSDVLGVSGWFQLIKQAAAYQVENPGSENSICSNLPGACNLPDWTLV